MQPRRRRSAVVFCGAVAAWNAASASALSSSPPASAELFSVAPMMAHTNRHYRYFFREFVSQRAHLYTEMIPSSQIVRAYQRAREIYLPNHHPANEHRRKMGLSDLHPEEVLEMARLMREDPGKEFRSVKGDREDTPTLHQLLRTSSSISGEYPCVLQLGGNNPETLGAAAAIGAAFEPKDYHEINLNCGCPSNAVGGRSGGCALMRVPEVVAASVERMNEGCAAVSSEPPGITVKHRLGVREAAHFDAVEDRAKGDEEAFEECRAFVRTVSARGDATKFHVHARLGLLGEFPEDDDSDGGKLGSTQQQRLWVPGAGDDGEKKTLVGKVDHKREQERARRRARRATIKNRSVPPLRPNVVHRLADEFPEYEFVTNGGIQSVEGVQKIVEHGKYGAQQHKVVGAMVGRAAINHPCSFSVVDELWDESGGRRRPLTRGSVLQEYMFYCDEEEERMKEFGASPSLLEGLRKRLVAVPFHLFVGEEGSDDFQRRLKKLREKCRTMKASSILKGAVSFVPGHTLDKMVDDFVPWEDIVQYDGGLKRGSAMQRVVY